MYERFTDRARKVMQLANQEAQRFNHEYIGDEHVLLGLIKEGSGVAANVLKNRHPFLLQSIYEEVEHLMQRGPGMVTMGKLPQTPRAKRVITYSMEEARNLNHNYVGTEHILLGLLREQEGVAAQVLMNLGLKLEEVREEVLNLLGQGGETVESSDQWKFQPQGDGARMRLLCGDRVVLVIDRMRVTLTDAGLSERTMDGGAYRPRTYGQGEWPSWEDRKLIEGLLNAAAAAGKD